MTDNAHHAIATLAQELQRLKDSLPTRDQIEKLSEPERAKLNAELGTRIRERGGRLIELAQYDPEAYYHLATLVFMVDMDRISLIGTTNERQVMVTAYVVKIKEYLEKYLTAAPTGTYSTQARALLRSVG